MKSKSGRNIDEPFPDFVITEVAALLKLSHGRQCRRLTRYLRELPIYIERFRRRDAIPRPAFVRDVLKRLEAACSRQLDGGAPFRPDRIRKRLEKDENASALVLWQMALKVDPQHPERAIEDGRAAKALSAATLDPGEMQQAAAAARHSVSTIVREGRGGDRHKPDWVLERVILDLGVLFLEATGEKPGISTDPDTREPTGLFVALLGICLPRLGWELSRDAIRSQFRKVRHEEGW